VKLSRNKSWRLRGRMECWASIPLMLGQTGRQSYQVYEPAALDAQRNSLVFLLQADWPPGLQNVERRTKSHEYFQMTLPGIEPKTSRLLAQWRVWWKKKNLVPSGNRLPARSHVTSFRKTVGTSPFTPLILVLPCRRSIRLRDALQMTNALSRASCLLRYGT